MIYLVPPSFSTLIKNLQNSILHYKIARPRNFQLLFFMDSYEFLVNRLQLHALVY